MLAPKKNGKYLIVHGHFYQPPRENPWLGEIETQPSAAPAHDWNERIHDECYAPNGHARTLSDEGKITGLVNNYQYLSYNFGPTLLSWMRDKHPETLDCLREGDKKSIQRLGHGNAIAQVYNHLIMPLTNAEDRKTQIAWGLQDFEADFGRQAESIWLGETAINNETAADLINAGVKYVILAPSQAQCVRSLDSNDGWNDVSSSNIDTKKTYRLFPKDESGASLCEGHLDILFYDDDLSRAVSFERILNSSETFYNRIASNFDGREDAQVLTIGTDGESYGHHHAYGEMCLSWMFEKLIPEGDFEVVNPGWYLEHFPPVDEVELKNGTGEGTAWSCAHGTGRWIRDCGCQTGGPEDWNQKWRGPLRNSLNSLRDDLHSLFSTQVSKLSETQPWDLRNNYIDVLRNPFSPEVHKDFCKKYLKKNTPENRTKLLTLLEMSKYSLYSFTSCGWFFNDFEGIEPLQNLKYARRAIEMANSLGAPEGIERKFLDILHLAISNETKRDGETIYQSLITQEIPLSEQVLATSIFLDGVDSKDFKRSFKLYDVTAKVLEGNPNSTLWTIEVLNKALLTTEKKLVVTVRSQFQEDLVICFNEGTTLDQVRLPEVDFKRKETVCPFYPNSNVISISDLLPDYLELIIQEKTHSSFEAICADFENSSEKYGLFFGLMNSPAEAVSIPEYISTPVKLSLHAQLNKRIRKIIANPNDHDLNELSKLAERAEAMNIKLNIRWLKEEVGELIDSLIKKLLKSVKADDVKLITSLIAVANITKMEFDRAKLENLVYPLYKQCQFTNDTDDSSWMEFIPLFQWLNFQI